MKKRNNIFISILLAMVIFPVTTWSFTATSIQGVFDENNTKEVKVTPDDCTTDDQFGHAVDVSGNFAIVGAYGNDDRAQNAGAAYMLSFDGKFWGPAQKLSASDAEAFDFFGFSVAMDRNYAIIGAYGDDDHGNKSGAAYIFAKNDNDFWYEFAKVNPTGSMPSDYFGCSVDISGKYMIVGAYGARDNGNDSGAAYIFKRDSSGVYQQQKLIAGDPEPLNYFGYSVSISGDYAIVGAYGKKYRGDRSGAAYIFKRVGNRWCQLIKLAPFDGSMNDYFGRSVAISGKYAIVGAIGRDEQGHDSGAAYIYKRSGFFWSRHVKIIHKNVSQNHCFGASVNISNEYAIIGAHGDNVNGQRTGAAYVYQLKRNTWNNIALFRPRDGADGDCFGYSVAISGSQIIAGAYGNDENGDKSGAAYLYGLFSSYPNRQ